MASIFDTENIYPDDDFWLEMGFLNLKKRGMWIDSHNEQLHWVVSNTETCWTCQGTVRIYVEYHKYSKALIIIQHTSSFYYDEVDFKPIKLHNPTQQEIKMVLSKDYLSSRLTYKHNK